MPDIGRESTVDPNSNGSSNSDFLSYLEQLESSGSNVPNTHQTTTSGQAQGYDQITTGTWQDFAPAAGVDLGKYPNALSAPQSVQRQVASTIPMHRWDPKTLNGLIKAGFTVDPNRTLGQNIALNGGALNAAPAGRIDPSTMSDDGDDPLADATARVKNGVIASAAAGVAPKSAPVTVPGRIDPSAMSDGEDPLAAASARIASTAATNASTPQVALAAPPQAAPAPQTVMGGPGGGLQFMNSLPVVGPSILKAGAGINALVNGDSYANERALQTSQMAEYAAQHPDATMAAQIGGGVVGSGAMVAAAPALFGVDAAAGLGTNMLAGAATNATVSGADAAARGGSPSSVGTSAAIGGLLGGAAPVVGAGMNALGRAVTGGAMAPENATLAALARDKYGIPLTNDQLSGDTGMSFLRSASDRLPFSGAGSDIATTQAGFNQAVSSTIGESATKLTPQVMTSAKARIGSMFDSVAANTQIKADPQFDNDLLKVVSDAQDSGMTADELRPVNKIFDSILDAVDPNTRTLSGSAYQTLTRANTPFGRALSNPNPNISGVAGDIKDALDDALGRSASPADLQTFQDAKSQWRNLRTIEGNVAQNGGDVSPARLASDLNNSRFSKNTMAYGGGGDLGELAAIGQKFMKPPQSSGTSERLAGLGMLGAVGAGGNALLQGSLAAAAPGLGFVPAALAANRLAVNPLLRSQGLANALINRSLPGAAGPATPSWLAATALGASTGRNALGSDMNPLSGFGRP
jgi:hypothetical protein